MRLVIKLVFFLLICSELSGQNQIIDSLELRLSATDAGINRLPVLAELVTAYSTVDLSKAKQYAKQGLALAQRGNAQDWEAQFNFLQGDILQTEGQYDAAQRCFSEALSYYQDTDSSQMAVILKEKGFAFQNQGKFQEASDHYFSALNIYEELKDEKGISNLYVSLTDILVHLEKPQEAIKYGRQAIAIFQKLGDYAALANAYKVTSHAYIFADRFEDALSMVDSAFRITEELGASAIELASLQNSKGNALKNIGRYEEALVEYEKCLAVARDFNHSRGISATLANIGDVYLRLERYEEALPPKLEGVLLQEKYEFTSNLPENYDHLSRIYKALGDYENALLYREKEAEISASALSLEVEQVTSELKTKYETEQKEALIRTQEERLQQQKTIQFFILGIVVLLGLILFLLYRSFRQKQSANQRLGDANSQLEQKNAENELLLQEIHHRVKNNLQVISSLLNLQSASINDPNALEAVQESQNRVRSMALIHQKLYQGKNLAAVEMKDYLETVGQTILDTFGEQAATISLRVDMEPLEVDVDTAVPLGLIVNELVINACKYAFPNGKDGEISLSLKLADDENYQLTVADNGVGKAVANKTATKGTGFGSRLVKLLTLQLNGKIEQHDEGGTFVQITFKTQVH